MTPNARSQSRRLLHWIIERNPTYLVSACLTAAGARMLLVGPADATGDLALILTTLGLVQLYMWAVGAILLVLHRARRSPEDRPSLLLVAAAFWTGPIAATIELMALDPTLGMTLATGVCVIAVAELRLACRTLGLSLAPAAQIIGLACIVLLAVAARLLKISDNNNGLNELFLYAAWWDFAAILLGVIAVVRRHWPNSPADPKNPASVTAPRQDVVFVSITLLATAVHLLAMNYGFFCHARSSYAAPAIVAVAVVGLAVMNPRAPLARPMALAFGLLPAVALLLAGSGFDPAVPIARLPMWLRDPVVAVFVCAAGTWWYGFRRYHATPFLHAAFVAFGFVVLRVVPKPIIAPAGVTDAIGPIALFLAAGYFGVVAVLLRSRLDAVAAIAVNFAAIAWLVIGRSPAAEIIVCLTFGWSVWLTVHVLSRSPNLFWRVAPVAFLVFAPWLLGPAPFHRDIIAANAIVLVNVLLVAGSIWPSTRYRTLALVLITGHAAAAAITSTTDTQRPAAGLLLVGGFAMLIGGALISWFKRPLVVAIADEPPPLSEPPST